MNCIFLRRGYGTSGDGVNYVEYIQSSGSQYFKTNFKPNQNTKVVCEVELLGSTNQAAFGARNGASVKSFFTQIQSSPNFRVDFGSQQNQTAIVLTSPNERKTITQDKNLTTVTPNGGTFTSNAETFQCDYPLYIGALNNAGNAACIATGKFCVYKIYDNGTLIHDYRAAVDDSGIACFYDKVEKAYCYWEGTLTAGPSISGGSSSGGNKLTIEFKDTADFAYVTTNGVTYKNSATVDIEAGQTITLYAVEILLNGEYVASGETYTFAASGNVSIVFTAASGLLLAYITTS